MDNVDIYRNMTTEPIAMETAHRQKNKTKETFENDMRRDFIRDISVVDGSAEFFGNFGPLSLYSTRPS